MCDYAVTRRATTPLVLATASFLLASALAALQVRQNPHIPSRHLYGNWAPSHEIPVPHRFIRHIMATYEGTVTRAYLLVSPDALGTV